MAMTAQVRAIKNYRKRLTQRGLARFEVIGLASDRELIRSVARQLAENVPESAELRALLHGSIATSQLSKGGVLAALRRSPMVGAELDLTRLRVEARKVEL